MINYNSIMRLKEKIDISEETIEKDYLIELLLGYISHNNHLRRTLVFRGGTALKKVYFPDFRFSEDLDFIVSMGKDFDSFEVSIKTMVSKIKKEWPIELYLKDALRPQKGHLQIFFLYDIVSEIKAIKELKVDIIEDYFVLKSRMRKIIFTYDDFADHNCSLNTYNLESIITEKMLRILDVVDEPRDLWDLLYLLKTDIKPELVEEAFTEKAGFDINKATLIEAINRSNYQRTWRTRLKNQISSLPEYKDVVNELELRITKLF